MFEKIDTKKYGQPLIRLRGLIGILKLLEIGLLILPWIIFWNGELSLFQKILAIILFVGFNIMTIFSFGAIIDKLYIITISDYYEKKEGK